MLLPIDQMPIVNGIAVPADVYVVLNTPATLAGMSYPDEQRWASLSVVGIKWVVCLTNDAVPYNPAPLQIGYCSKLTDLYGGEFPRNPDKEEQRVRAAAARIVTFLLAGEGVVVHCVGGTGRTGSVLGCVLVSLGYAPSDVIIYLDDLHRARGRRGWPESPWQAEVVKRARHSGT
jgi:protein-tyrosine phosphatase